MSDEDRREASRGPSSDPLEPLRSPGFLIELRRKAIHLAFVLLPLALLHDWLPWPRSHGEWALLLLAAAAAAAIVDLMRLHDRRVKGLVMRYFGPLIRKHEKQNLLGSTYLLLAALLAFEIFPRPIAAAAIGMTVLGDGVAAIVGKAYGRTPIFSKSVEGAVGGLAACGLWAGYLVVGGHLPWYVAVSGALAASLIELLPIPLDDNLGMTLVSGYVMKLLVGAL